MQRTTDFIGIASLNGQIQYINPAGLELVGLDALDHALRLHVLDFVSPQNRTMVSARSGRWCFAPGGGRESSTSGILDLECRYPFSSIASGSTIRAPESR